MSRVIFLQLRFIVTIGFHVWPKTSFPGSLFLSSYWRETLEVGVHGEEDRRYVCIFNSNNNNNSSLY